MTMNPMFDFMENRGRQITEQEIQVHKNKLNYLTNRLINVHDVDEEILINNEIKVESECLFSLLNIKKQEIEQHNMQNNNMNNNNFFNPMFNQNNMNNNPNQQFQQLQMLQQQMMQQQMMAQQQMV